jgi:hypothetical protein
MKASMRQFAVGMTLASVIFGLLILNSGLSHAEDCPEPIIWVDDFESYTPGQFPSLDWSYTGNSNITVDDSKSVQGNQSLRIHGSVGGCWEAIPCRLLEVSTAEGFTIEFYMYIGSDHREGCHPWTGGAGLYTECDWTTGQGVPIVNFWYDGRIGSRIGDLGTYEYDTWYKIKMKYEREDLSTVKLSYWIDDAFMGSQSVSAAPYEDDLLYLHYSSGDGTIWADDIEVGCVLDYDPLMDIILNDTDFISGDTLKVDLHVINDATSDLVDVKIWIELPNGSLVSEFNVPHVFIPENTDITIPVYSQTFRGTEPVGSYKLSGRFLNWINGDIRCEDTEPFSFAP